MPGGTDISLAASQADNYTFGAPYTSNVLFPGAYLEGGSAQNQQRDSADATSTNRSPGTVNSAVRGNEAPFPSLSGTNGSRSPLASDKPNILLYTLIGLGVLVLWKK